MRDGGRGPHCCLFVPARPVKRSLVDISVGAGAAAVTGIVCLYALGVITTRPDPEVDRIRAELVAERDSTASWRQRAAAAAAAAKRLRDDSARVYPQWVLAKDAAAAGVWAVRQIAAAARARGDTATAATLESAAIAVDEERAACSVVVLNCEQRAANAEAARADAAARVDSLAAKLDTLGVKWEDAEQRAQPSFFRDLWRAKGVLGPLMVILGLAAVAK